MLAEDWAIVIYNFPLARKRRGGTQWNPDTVYALKHHFASGKIYGITVEADKVQLPTLAVKSI